MCTIGAVRLNDTESILFKNKDFADVGFSDKLVLSEDYFGPQGLETFSGVGKEPVFSGLSLGANNHGLMACVNHVKMTGPKSLNYDLLVLDVIKTSASVEEACEHLNLLIERQSYWWGNLVLADQKNIAVVEVRDLTCRIQLGLNRAFRTNHQPLFGETASPDGIECSALRYGSVARRFGHVSSVDDVISMLSTHDSQGNSTGICNHSDSLKTVYSYVLHQKEGRTILHVCRGTPCNSQWVSLPLPLGCCWSPKAHRQFLMSYPN